MSSVGVGLTRSILKLGYAMKSEFESCEGQEICLFLTISETLNFLYNGYESDSSRLNRHRREADYSHLTWLARLRKVELNLHSHILHGVVLNRWSQEITLLLPSI
jgi:hypothetical protein